ncbi:MAG: nucleotidyltransferase domain-containing protein [bacterium]
MQNNILISPKYSNYLTNNERNALSELKEKITEKYPGAEFILYGSKARGDYNENSDIDILIVINDNYNIDKNISFEELEKRYFLPVDRNIEDKISDILVDIQVKYCVSIDYQIKNKSYIKTNLAGIVPLYQNIKKDGIEL